MSSKTLLYKRLPQIPMTCCGHRMMCDSSMRLTWFRRNIKISSMNAYWRCKQGSTYKHYSFMMLKKRFTQGSRILKSSSQPNMVCLIWQSTKYLKQFLYLKTIQKKFGTLLKSTSAKTFSNKSSLNATLTSLIIGMKLNILNKWKIFVLQWPTKFKRSPSNMKARLRPWKLNCLKNLWRITSFNRNLKNRWLSKSLWYSRLSPV